MGRTDDDALMDRAEINRLIREGYRNYQIANAIGCCQHTVMRRRRKLGLAPYEFPLRGGVTPPLVEQLDGAQRPRVLVIRRKPKPAAPRAITIDRGIPIPESSGAGRPALFPFEDMEIGDSFLTGGKQKTISSAASYWAKKLGTTYATRKTSKGYRVWRVS